MILHCPDCDESFDTKDQSGTDPAGVLCGPCYARRFDCKECGEQCVDPDEEDMPAKQLTCRTCHAIGRADHERDVAKDRRVEERT